MLVDSAPSIAIIKGGSASAGMTFLNDVSSRYPKAISLAAGRPADQFCSTRNLGNWFDAYVASRCGAGISEGGIYQQLGQYSTTIGIINDLIAKYLAEEEKLDLSPETIAITNGFQEALLIELLTLSQIGGAVIAIDPTYVGLSGAAAACGLPVISVRNEDGLLHALKRGAHLAREKGHRHLGAYVAPDFSNPSGYTAELTERHELVAWAASNDVTLYEDTAYRVFNYDRPPLPSLLAIDDAGAVVQLGTFSKMFLPSARVGFSARRTSARASTAAAVELKSFTSVATSPVCQAIAGGWLNAINFQPRTFNADRRTYYRTNRDLMLRLLTQYFEKLDGIKWNTPEGGFFINLTLPFQISEQDVHHLAADYGVIVAPMQLFSLLESHSDTVRLAFSNVPRNALPEAIDKLSTFVFRRNRAGAGTA